MNIKNKPRLLSNIWKTPLLRNFLLASLVISAIFPFFSVFYIIPSFNRMLTVNTEDEAIRTASYLRDLVIKEDAELTKTSFSNEDIREIKKLTKDFRLEKLKIFSKQGEIIFSTAPKDIGETNKNDYFQNVVAKGNVYTMIVQKNTKSMEGQIVTTDVVETYVPLLSNGSFIGAFEIYYDITDRKEMQGTLLAFIYLVLFSIVFIFLIVVIFILFKASKNTLEKEHAEEALRESEEKHRILFESSRDAIMTLVPPSWGFTTGNPATIEMFQAGEEASFTELGPWDLSPEFQPDGRPSSEKAAEMIQTAMVKGSHYFEWTHRRLGGESFPATVLLTRMEIGGQPLLQATVRDITDRKRMEEEILALSITDQLTGLHNRRGFLSLAGQQLKIAERNKNGMLLFFADLDGLKWINDTLGHEEGDKALIEAATVIKETSRTSDIIARLGGDEYAALAVDVPNANSKIFTARLQSLIDTRNNQENRRYKLSISVGCSYYDPENPCSLDELMASADKLMYEQKLNKKGTHPQDASLSNGIH